MFHSSSFPAIYICSSLQDYLSTIFRTSCGLAYITEASKIIALVEIERVQKKHFIPHGRVCGIGLRGFLIKSGARRGVSNGNMYVRPRDFAGGVRLAPFVKRGCDSITMEFIQPSIYPFIHPSRRAEVGMLRHEESDGKKFFFFLHFLSLP